MSPLGEHSGDPDQPTPIKISGFREIVWGGKLVRALRASVLSPVGALAPG
jgi:hypothetical protein